jgi:hypothetical protein
MFRLLHQVNDMYEAVWPDPPVARLFAKKCGTAREMVMHLNDLIHYKDDRYPRLNSLIMISFTETLLMNETFSQDYGYRTLVHVAIQTLDGHFDAGYIEKLKRLVAA